MMNTYASNDYINDKYIIFCVMKIVLYCDYEQNNINVNNVRDYLSKKINVPGLTVKNIFVECDAETQQNNHLNPGEQYIFEDKNIKKTHEYKKRNPDDLYHDYDDIKNMPTL